MRQTLRHCLWWSLVVGNIGLKGLQWHLHAHSSLQISARIVIPLASTMDYCEEESIIQIIWCQKSMIPCPWSFKIVSFQGLDVFSSNPFKPAWWPKFFIYYVFVTLKLSFHVYVLYCIYSKISKIWINFRHMLSSRLNADYKDMDTTHTQKPRHHETHCKPQKYQACWKLLHNTGFI